MAPQTTVGAGTLVYINNLPYALATAVSYTSSTPRKTQYGIDDIIPKELLTLQTHTRISLQVVKTYGDGGAEGQAITTAYSSLLREKYFAIKIVDRVSGFVMFEAKNCSLMDQSWQIQSRGIITGSLSIEAIDWGTTDLV